MKFSKVCFEPNVDVKFMFIKALSLNNLRLIFKPKITHLLDQNGCSEE